MKQIALTDEVRAWAKEYADNLFSDRRSTFIQPLEGLRNLQIDLAEVNDDLEDKVDFIAYLEKIIDEYDELKQLPPSKFEKRKEEYDDLLDPGNLSNVVCCRNKRLPPDAEIRKNLEVYNVVFYEEVVARMRYDEARPVVAKYMMEKMHIQTCIYCNNADAVYADENEEAYYHLDHWKPKDKYPFLSICFFNLYPCCSNCNGHKLDGDKGSFQLSADGTAVADPFVFTVDRKQYEEMKPDTLSVKFNARNIADEEFCKEYCKVYRIKEQYNAPSSLRQVEKLIYDIDSHRGSYPNATDKSFPGIVDKQRLFHFVLGIDNDEKNIFTDVKKKLKLDTAIDAGLL